jgi:hypothetical protein
VKSFKVENIYLFIPFKDELFPHTQSDFQSSLDAYPFEDANLFYKDF